ncbi:MAG: hypothetical protein GXP32_04335 [Kiritimatiellaeota bacterium]|nr:hypothetical protein [Kiritimatiellota bacterium]
MKCRIEQNDVSAIRRVTWWGVLVNILLSGIKIVFGVYVRSQALLADIHFPI